MKEIAINITMDAYMFFKIFKDNNYITLNEYQNRFIKNVQNKNKLNKLITKRTLTNSLDQ